ncbi:hypothetical protein ACFLSQ_07075 [Bacteroidota bacterium]
MKKINYAVVALLSVTLIALELAWMRIFSAEYFYTFAFLILSLSILGLGMGALTLRLFPSLGNVNKLGLLLSLASLMALAGPPLVFQLELDFSLLLSFGMILKLFVTIILLSSPFFFGGIALAFIFKSNNREMPRLYMFDLLGAGSGVFIGIFLMHQFGTPLATFLIALPVILAALLTISPKLRIVPAILLIGMIILCTFSEDILEVERKEPAPVIYKHWDAMSKIKIYQYDNFYRGITIDNHASTTVVGFDGNYNSPYLNRVDFFGINVGHLIRQFDNCTFLALGAGGGKDVMHALVEGAAEVHAVEVNPLINEMMLEGDLAEFTGHIYSNPKVKVVTEDARAYVRRFKNKFDLIFSFSSNSYAALASGAFALAENYIYTTEAFRDYWEAATDNGFIVVEHHFYVPRMVSEVMDALIELGIPNVKRHFAVYDLPEWRRQLLLISKKPLSYGIMANAIGGLGSEHHNIKLIYPPSHSQPDNLINKIVENGWEKASEFASFDISPSTDDRPFTPQMGLWKNFSWDRLSKLQPFEEFFGFPLSKLIIVIILLIVIILIIPLNLLPYLMKGKKLKTVPWLYFFTIGMAFMIVEVILIQKYTLFIGPSVYSIVTILFTLLICSGIGSSFSEKFSKKIIFPAIFILLLLDVFVFTHLIYVLGGLEMFPRILITALLIAPLGFFMGMPFPKGALRAGSLVDWGFAVNGAASVLGSTLIVLIAFSYGFSVALLLGALLYLGAFILITRKSSW